MTTTYTVLDSLVRARVALSGVDYQLSALTDPVLTPTVITNHINAAIKTMCSDRSWDWLLLSTTITVTSGSASLAAVSPAIGTIRTVQIAGMDANAVSVGDLVSSANYASAAPAYAISGISGGTGYTLLTNGASGSSQSVVIWYYAMPADLTSSDTFYCPLGFEAPVVSYAAYLCFLDRQAPDWAAMNLAQYNRELVRLTKIGTNVASRAKRRRRRPDWGQW